MSQPAVLQALYGDSEGEAATGALSADQRSRVEASLAALRTACAVPPLDRQKLLTGLKRIDALRGVKVIGVRRPFSRPVRYAAAALLVISAGAMLLALSPALRELVWKHNPAPRTIPPKPQEFRDGMWRFDAGPTVRAERPDSIVMDDAQTLALESGEADLNTDGVLREPLTLLTGLDRALSVSVSAPSKCTARTIPEKRMLALSVYSGAPGSVRVTKSTQTPGTSLEVGGENVDIVVQLATQPTPVERANGAKLTSDTFVCWADIRAALPPVCAGEVYLKLNDGRLLRGIVTSASQNGMLLTIAGTRGAVPESILNSEVSAWAPAETPRGRKLYAEWLKTALPEQLRGISRQWIEFLARREVTPDQAPATFTLPVAAFPDVAYSVREGNGKLYFFVARPASGLGESWQLDEHGKAATENMLPSAKQEF